MKKRSKWVKYPLVEICWIDSHRRDGWRDLEEILRWGEDNKDKEARVYHVGYLLKKTKEWITISGGLGEDYESALCSHRIIRKTIKKMRYL